TSDDNPTLHEGEPNPALVVAAADLPPLVPSTNPLFPGAIVKKPANSHAKTSLKPSAGVGAVQSPTTPKIITGKNAPSTPHSLTTRGTSRKSMGAETEAEMEGMDERMDED
ncbi:hypothetical protein P7C73_g2458, partial [Tremellales sp. Uapishka_1]